MNIVLGPLVMHLLAIEPFTRDLVEIYKRHYQRVAEYILVFPIYRPLKSMLH